MDVIDQTWVSDWIRGVPTVKEVLDMKAWVKSVPSEIQEVLKTFPPRCIVKSRTLSLPVPYMFSVGFIDTYHLGGRVTVCQNPGGASAVVKLEDLSFVAPWHGMTRECIRALVLVQPSL